MEAIKKDFGSVEKMEELLSNKTIAVQGSGWGWLGYNKETKHLELAVTFNQDTLEATTGMFSGPLHCYCNAYFQGSYRYSALMCGSMLITSNTKTFAQTL